MVLFGEYNQSQEEKPNIAGHNQFVSLSVCP